MERSSVGNAADREQVRHAQKDDRHRAQRDLLDLRTLLAMPEGRRFMWRLIHHYRPNASFWHPSAQIHYNAGMADAGLYLMNEIENADPGAMLLMTQEHYAARLRDQVRQSAPQQALDDDREADRNG